MGREWRTYLGILSDEACGDDDGRRSVQLRPGIQLGVGHVVFHVHVVAVRRWPHLHPPTSVAHHGPRPPGSLQSVAFIGLVNG